MIIFWILIFFECLIAGRILKRTQAPAAPLLILAYIISLQTMYLIATYDTFDAVFSDLSLLSFKSIPERVLLLYSLIFIITSASCRNITLHYSKIKQELTKWSISKSNILTRWSAIAVFYTIIAINIAFIDFDIMWSNNTYLLMNSPQGYDAPEQMVTLMRFGIGLTGALGAFSLPVLLAGKNISKFICILPGWLFIFVFQLSAHSRTAAAYAFILCFSIINFSKIPKLLSLPISIFFILLILIFSLEGRAQNLHGVGELLSSIDLAYESFDSITIISTLINLFQGIFTTGDALIEDAEHTFYYKILSISPFPSFIDGFDSIRDGSEIRLHQFIPMSAIAEAYHFGILFYLPILIFYYLLLRQAIILLRSHNNIISVFINVYIFIIFIQANAYPLRNTFRQLLISFIIIYFYRHIHKLRTINNIK